MVCLFCFDDSPIPDDPKVISELLLRSAFDSYLLQAFRPNTFQISLVDGLTQNQPVCCLTYLLPCCSAYYTRYRTLDGNMTRYTCCQGYLDNACFRAGSCGEQSCPEFCLVCETVWCLGPSMSTSRMFVMDQYDLRPDPCDNQLVRMTNCLMMLSCVCDILSIFMRELRHAAHILHVVANMVFYSLLGCMAAQVNREIDYRRSSLQDYAQLTPDVGAPFHGYTAPVHGEPVPDTSKDF